MPDTGPSDIQTPPQQAECTGSETVTDPHVHLGHSSTDACAQGYPNHLPDHTNSSHTRHLPSRFRPNLPPSLLLDYLTASDANTYNDIKAQLPPGYRRIDAYLLLRECDPQSLSALSFLDIWYLITKAGSDNLGGVLALLLQDIIGTDMSTSKAKPGYFQILSGTEERYKLLREIIVRCSRSIFLLHDGAALNIFMLMLDDLLQLRQSTTCELSTTASPSTKSSLAEGSAITLPNNFPLGETRRLMRLAAHLHNPELAPVVNALRSHLETHTADFPTAREGSYLIAYYLQPNLRDFEAALDVVRALRDTNALPQEAVDDAVRSGKTYLASLQSMFASVTEDSQPQPSDVELQQICMDVSLRIIAMKSLMAHRPKGGVQYRKAFESLVASFRFDLIDTHHGSRRYDMRALLDVPMRIVRNVFLHLVGQNDPSCLAEAKSVLQRSDQRLIAMLPNSDLQEFCNAARNAGSLSLAAETYMLFAKAKTSSASTAHLPSDSNHHILARDGMMVDADTFLAIMRELVTNGQKIAVSALLRVLHLLPLHDASVGHLNLRFSTTQRSRLIALLAQAGLVEEAFLLFQYWSHYRYEAGSDSDQSRFGTVSLRHASVQIADPLIERQMRLMHDADRHVATAPECLVALVRGICRHSSAKVVRRLPRLSSDCLSEEAPHVFKTPLNQLQKARFVIDVFRQACTPVDWTHYRLSALAQACFIAKDAAGAFDALAKISFLREMPDKVDINIVMGGLVELDADRAVDLFIQHCTAPYTVGEEKKAEANSKTQQAETKFQKPVTLAPMQPTPRLTSTLISRALAQNRLDLVDRLHKFSESVGIVSGLGYDASIRALFSEGLQPGQVRQMVHCMVKDGWMADAVLAESLTRHLLRRSMPPIQQRRAKLPLAKDRLLLFQSACYLMRVVAERQDSVNLRTVSQALDVITYEGSRARRKSPTSKSISTSDTDGGAYVSSLPTVRHRGREERRMKWIAALDSIVRLLRWTRFFDSGDDLRQSLPLWKSSSTGNGELVSAELDEMLDHGFTGSRRRKSRVMISTATAATLPISSDAAPLGFADDLANGINPLEAAFSDGAVQRMKQRSPNVLPPELFRRLMEAYLKLGDVSGAAETASWMRDEANIDLGRTEEEAADFANHIKAAILEQQANGQTSFGADTASDHKEPQGSQVLRLLAGQQSTARIKSWWSL